MLFMTGGSKSRHFDRVRFRLFRTDIEPDNDHTDTPTTTSIDGLFYLSLG